MNITWDLSAVEIHEFNSLLFNPAEFKRSFSQFFHIRSSYHQRETGFTSKLQIEERKNEFEAKWWALAAQDPGIPGIISLTCVTTIFGARLTIIEKVTRFPRFVILEVCKPASELYSTRVKSDSNTDAIYCKSRLSLTIRLLAFAVYKASDRQNYFAYSFEQAIVRSVICRQTTIAS